MPVDEIIEGLRQQVRTLQLHHLKPTAILIGEDNLRQLMKSGDPMLMGFHLGQQLELYGLPVFTCRGVNKPLQVVTSGEPL